MLRPAHRSTYIPVLLGLALGVVGLGVAALVPTSPAAGSQAADRNASEPRAGDASQDEESVSNPALETGEGSSLAARVSALLEREQTALAAVRTEFERAVGSADVARQMALQRRIDLIKQETELRVMEMQLQHLRAKGLADEAQALDDELAPMRTQVKTARARVDASMDLLREGER